MTCIIGGIHKNGVAFIAADSCVTWEAKGSRRYEDTVQKLYGLAPNVAVALSGTLTSAKKLLQSCRDALNPAGEVGSVMARASTIRRLPGLLEYTWESSKLRGEVVLIIAVSDHQGKVRVFKWDSRDRKNLTELKPGEVTVSGSIEELRKVYGDFKIELQKLVVLGREGVDLSASQVVALLSDALSRVSAGQAGREAGVGGAFQIAVASGAEFVCYGYEARSLGSGGDTYQIFVTWDNKNKRWLQINKLTGEKVLLETVDERDFSRTPLDYHVFNF